MSLREVVAGAGLAAAAILSSVAGSHAQQGSGEPLYITGTIECSSAIRPYETTVCSHGVLAAMDLQMQTLYRVVERLVKPEAGLKLEADHQAFLRAREACAGDANCLGQTYAGRIQQIDQVLQDIVSRGPY